METFEDYKARLMSRFNSDSIPPSEWRIAANIMKKVSEDGMLKPFYGYTSVFSLGALDSDKCRAPYDLISHRLKDLVILLPVDTFHLTLHTFWNQNNSGSAEDVDRRFNESYESIKSAMDEITAIYQGREIEMFSPGVSTNGTDVISLKFIPASDDSYRVIMDLFQRMESICPLGQPYVPHISFAYFKRMIYSDEQIADIYKAIEEANRALGCIHINLPITSLAVMKHCIMSSYIPLKLSD